MPVGAIIGAGALTAGGAVVASKSNSKAINKATAAQTQSNTESVALQRDIYGQNKAVLSPFVQRGNAAGEAMNALLGLTGTNDNVQQLPAQQPNALAQYAYGFEGMDGPRGGYRPYETMGGDRPTMPGPISGFGGGTFDMQGNPVTVGTQGQPAPNAAANAFDIFRNSTGYKFRLGQGMDAVNSGYAGRGVLQSGAAIKAINEYGQDFASGEFGNYLGYLGNQQGVGLSGASALAGVGQGYANNITSMNQNNANALGQIAVARANNNNALIQGIGSAVGNTVGVLGGMGKL